MFRSGLTLLAALLTACAGCVKDRNTTLVSSDPFDSGTPAASTLTRVSLTPAQTATAARVDLLGRKLVAANPQMGIRPMFQTIGVPQPEVFHRGTAEVFVTEGLVNQCQTEAQLAAVLCHELGKMVSEREALTAKSRVVEPEPPMDVRIGNDYAGGTSPDMTHLAEQAKFAPPARRASSPRPLPPDPNVLARAYLVKAQFVEADLDSVEPLLKAAAANCAIEKQFNPAAHP